MKVLRAVGFEHRRGALEHQRGGFEYQRGGFAMGIIVGLLIGLALALAVALYVTKAPVPFMNKVPQRTAEQDAAEVEKNRNWDPNSPLYGKNPAKAASGVVTQAAAVPASAASAAAAAASTPRQIAAAARAASAAAAASSAKAKPKRDPNDILNDRAAGFEQPTTVSTIPSVAASNNSQTVSTRPGADPFLYFVQAGAYARQEDADQQRARLAMQGFAPKVTEREQAGRTVYRVRVGPYDKKDDADSAKEKLDSAGVESALVRVQK
jgi:cell division protein FtsN